MKIKLEDIARRAGVSLTTVSRVINNDTSMSVSKETEEKIWKYVNELGYKVNNRKNQASPGKKNKKASKNKSIGYILTLAKEKYSDSVFTKIINGLEQELMAQRYDLGFAYTVYDLEDPLIFNNVLSSNVSGVVIIGHIPLNYYTLLIKQIPNCVSLFEIPESKPVDCITVDLEDAAYRLTRSLILSGHRNIAFIGGKSYNLSPEVQSEGFFYNHDERFQGYLKALFDRGIDINHAVIKDGDWDIETAYRKMGEIVDSNEETTAVFAASDKMAIGAMRALQERGKRIPEDISVVGFDDIEMSKYTSPPLTTVFYPKEEMGKLAVKMLIEKSVKNSENDEVTKKILFPAHIVERESVKVL